MVQKMPPTATPRKRPLRPRATDAIQVVPPVVSDRTSAALVGLDGRAFREWLRGAGVPFATHGRRVLARTSDVLEALERASTQAPASGVELVDEDDDDVQPTTADEVLASLGRVRR